MDSPRCGQVSCRHAALFPQHVTLYYTVYTLSSSTVSRSDMEQQLYQPRFLFEVLLRRQGPVKRPPG